jgi:OmpA-OmpF porin, OOP family
MKRYSPILMSSLAALLSACASAPDSIPELDAARVVVAQVEASPRAGVAAANISEARKAVDRAEELSRKNGKVEDIRFQADIATRHAQIANEKILTAQANDDVAKGTAERQQVLLEARAREADVARQRAQSLEQELQGLRTSRTERGLVLTLGDVLFDTGKATLKPGAFATLDRVAAALNDSPARKVAIEGHTDSTGAEQMNQALSEQRALAVQSALMQRGVSGTQIVAVGKGEAMPVASNDDPSGRQQNRRVELILSEDAPRVASDAH